MAVDSIITDSIIIWKGLYLLAQGVVVEEAPWWPMIWIWWERIWVRGRFHTSVSVLIPWALFGPHIIGKSHFFAQYLSFLTWPYFSMNLWISLIHFHQMSNWCRWEVAKPAPVNRLFIHGHMLNHQKTWVHILYAQKFPWTVQGSWFPWSWQMRVSKIK